MLAFAERTGLVRFLTGKIDSMGKPPVARDVPLAPSILFPNLGLLSPSYFFISLVRLVRKQGRSLVVLLP